MSFGFGKIRETWRAIAGSNLVSEAPFSRSLRASGDTTEDDHRRLRGMRLYVPGLPRDAQVDFAFVNHDGVVVIHFRSDSFAPDGCLSNKNLYDELVELPQINDPCDDEGGEQQHNFNLRYRGRDDGWMRRG